MKIIKLKFTKITVMDFAKGGSLPVRFYYEIDGKESYLQKQYSCIREDPEMFAADAVAEVKAQCRKSIKPDYNDDVLPEYVNVQLQESRDGHAEERLSNALKQIKDRVRNVRSMATSQNYMTRYVDIKGMTVDLS